MQTFAGYDIMVQFTPGAKPGTQPAPTKLEFPCTPRPVFDYSTAFAIKEAVRVVMETAQQAVNHLADVAQPSTYEPIRALGIDLIARYHEA